MVEPRGGRGWWRLAVLLPLYVGVLGLGLAQAASLQLRADPDRLPADGTSQAVIVAEVTGESGMPVPDGTMVRFMSSLGKIVSPVQTVGGLAQTSLTASRTAGTAVVSAIAGADRQVLEVEFGALPGSTAPGDRTVELRADELAYSAEHCLFVATDHVKLTSGRITISADGLQYEVASNAVRAQGNVVLSAAGTEVKADALLYDLLSLRGRLVRLTDQGGEHLSVEGDPPVTQPDENKDEALWGPLRTDDTRAWVKARRAIVDPGDKIILDHATFYVDDTKVLSLRRHVIPPRPSTALLGQVVGFSSIGGLQLDYPYYYRASTNDVGAIYLRRNTATGNQFQPGWALGLTEDYTREGKMDGSFSLDDLLHPSLGYRWQHQQRFAGDLSINAEVNSLSLQDGLPGYRTAGFNAHHPLGDGSLSLSLGASSYGVSKEQYADLGYRFGSFRVANGVAGTPSLHLRETDRQVQAQGVVIDPITGEPMTFDTTNGGRSSSLGFNLGLSFRPRDFGKLHLTGNLSTGFTESLSGGGGRGGLGTRWTLERRFDHFNYLGLSLNLSTRATGDRVGLLSSGQKAVSLTARTRVKGADLGVRLSQDLGGDRRYGQLTLNRSLPFGRDMFGQALWDLSARYMFSQFNTFGARNTVLSLGRIVGRYRASLNYSPQGGGSYLSDRPWLSPLGFGYTYSGGKNVWVEFSAAAE